MRDNTINSELNKHFFAQFAYKIMIMSTLVSVLIYLDYYSFHLTVLGIKVNKT